MLTLLRATNDDAMQITTIKTLAYNAEINAYLGRDGGPQGYDEISSQLNIIKSFYAYKVLLDEKIIGAFFLYPINKETMGFEDFVIHPSYQNKGYGFEVMKLNEQLNPDITEWRLSTPTFSIGNQHLYSKFGYVEVSRDEDEIHYVKHLIK